MGTGARNCPHCGEWWYRRDTGVLVWPLGAGAGVRAVVQQLCMVLPGSPGEGQRWLLHPHTQALAAEQAVGCA